MDEVVNQTMSRTTDAQGAERALQVRRSQGRDRQRLVDEIDTAQQQIATINEERAPLAVEVRKVESEVGPIKYVAALLYGDNPDTNLLERAVRWMIILLVAVFDPLAVALLIAANQTLRKHGIHLEPEDKPHGDKPSELVSNDSTNTADHTAGDTPQPTGGTAEESNNIQNSEPERSSTDSVLLQQSGTTDNQPEVNDQLTSLEATTEAQKKRSSNYKKKTASSKKKITANRKKS
jgi:hypothetical protein